jgi:NAD(P)-dependent dehydrogenase (short-subunit alcohol dehydrogenase family)
MDSSTMTAATGALSDRLLGQKVLVTGSSKGIGRGIAVRLAQEGADVVINYNSDPGGAEEALAEVKALGRRGAIVKANLGTVAEVRDLVEQSAAALGGLDVLVNNAGIEKHAAFWGRDRERFRRRDERQPERRLLRDAGVRAAVPGCRSARQDHQHQLGSRGAGVSELRRLLCQQGWRAHVDANAGG